MNYKIVAKYIKDLKFEIPNPKVFFSLEKDITNYKINIDIKSNQSKTKIVKVKTKLPLNQTNENESNRKHNDKCTNSINNCGCMLSVLNNCNGSYSMACFKCSE